MSRAKTNALAILEPPGPKGIGKMKSGDRNIWLMKKRGWSSEQLAARFGVKETAIQSAIDRYQLYRDGSSNDEVDFELNKMVTKLLPKVEKVLTDGMVAQHEIVVGRGKATIIKKVADHATRLKTLEVMKAFRETTQPKGGGINVNTQINTNQNPVPAGPRGFDFEARLRKIREEEGLSNDDDKMLDAEYEDDESGTVMSAREMEDIGMDPDGEGEEDEE